MSGIPYLINSVDNSFGMAFGTYRDEQAIAAGYQRRLAAQVSARVSLTWDTGQGAGMTAGMAMGW
ncbi:YadA-like family protein [Pantoea ananatis]|nr:YadA-like family protein [Pantoea ananatis]